MSDSYQAIYDAVRSRISNGDIGSAARDVMFQHFDVSSLKAMAQDVIGQIQYAYERPSVVYRPQLSRDGSSWIALYGPNLQEGCVGCGDSPEEAMSDFDISWRKKVPMIGGAK